MNNKVRARVIVVVLLVIALIGIFVFKGRRAGPKENGTKTVRPRIGAIRSIISTTGTVLPKNRLEVKPPVNGRIESILVKEGDFVKPAQPLAWMSSMERAALLDAAKGKGADAVKYWQEVYKAIPLLAPIEGEVIVATIQPGQTVTTADPIVVLSDRLIVRAEVDETDIANIKDGQDALITIDAYPDEKVPAKVEHLYYESKTVNNVTIYEVDLMPETIPAFFRSGMNASVDFTTETRASALLVPFEAVQRDKGQTFVVVRAEGKEMKELVTVGITDDKEAEIVSGIGQDADVVITTKRYTLPATPGQNPLVPTRGRR